MKHLGNILFFWVDAYFKYASIRDSDRRETSTVMGVHSIAQVLSGLIVSLLAVCGLLASINALDGDGFIVIFAAFGVFICAVAAVAAILGGLLRGLMYWIFQLKLNKRPIGKVAMVLWILSLIAAIAGSVLLVINL